MILVGAGLVFLVALRRDAIDLSYGFEAAMGLLLMVAGIVFGP